MLGQWYMGIYIERKTTEGDQESICGGMRVGGGPKGGHICILTAGSCFAAETNITL